MVWGVVACCSIRGREGRCTACCQSSGGGVGCGRGGGTGAKRGRCCTWDVVVLLDAGCGCSCLCRGCDGAWYCCHAPGAGLCTGGAGTGGRRLISCLMATSVRHSSMMSTRWRAFGFPLGRRGRGGQIHERQQTGGQTKQGHTPARDVPVSRRWLGWVKGCVCVHGYGGKKDRVAYDLFTGAILQGSPDRPEHCIPSSTHTNTQTKQSKGTFAAQCLRTTTG